MTEQRKYCDKCGATVVPAAEFCRVCGAELAIYDPATAAAPAEQPSDTTAAGLPPQTRPPNRMTINGMFGLNR